ncbi:MAG: hypothetical protein JXA18_16990 [Chitinispirillaceae bacterium]|nr:hypothetical protein [Chitinispirillaceae bacterium]
MKFNDFRNRMAPFTLFSLRDTRILDPGFDRRRLYEWSAKGYLKLIAKGWYLFADTSIDENTLDWIANRIYAPSYISLETIMSRTSLIPDTVHAITSITTRKTRTIQTVFSKFIYRTVSPRLFFGYTLGPHEVKIALPEKAILDYLYLHTDIRTREDFESLRVDRQALVGRINRRRFDKFLKHYTNKALQRRAELFFTWVCHA